MVWILNKSSLGEGKNMPYTGFVQFLGNFEVVKPPEGKALEKLNIEPFVGFGSQKRAILAWNTGF